MIYQLKVNSRYQFELNRTDSGLLIDELAAAADIRQIGANSYHVIENNISYRVEVLKLNLSEKTAQISVNNSSYLITAKDQYDALLDKLGLNDLSSARISELRAPMPGMVLRVFASEGEQVNKGDNLFILEAMKMENIIKSPAALKIKKINIKAGDKVEKGQIIIEF